MDNVIENKLSNLLINCLNWTIVSGMYNIKICDINQNDLSFSIRGNEIEKIEFQNLVQKLYDSGRSKIILRSLND